MYHKLLYFLFFIFSSLAYSQANKNDILIDSISFYKNESKDKSKYNNQERLFFAKKAKVLSIDLGIDSILIYSNRRISTVYWELKDYDSFERINRENLSLASKEGDSSSLAKANFKLGKLHENHTFRTDSAYFYFNKAEKIYRDLNDEFGLAQTLYEIASIQKDEKDFTGSELLSIEGVRVLNQLEQTNSVRLYKSYLFNNLGIVFNQLGQYEESISYHKKALKLKNNLRGNNESSIDNSKNNLAIAYKGLKNYELALDYFNQILKNKNLIYERPSFYALVLDNHAHTSYLSQNLEELPGQYIKALRICDSLDNSIASYNSIIIHQHLAEYYNDLNQKDSAKYHAYKAKDISEDYHNDDLLKSLLLLSQIEEGEKSANHLKDYVKLNDSLQKAERSIRNKFARIRFETKQIQEENIQIAKERTWLLIISIILILASFLLYLVISQRNKNKELQFIQKQQKANEEIYNLMLSQNEGIEEARSLEKKRISQELHDGVLGRLFGTRLSLDSLNMSNSKEAVTTRSQYIDGLKTIEDDIRKVSHELNTDFVSGSGFIDIIKTLIETQTIAYKIKYELKHDDAISWDTVSNKKKIHIYRIIQETLHNIYKHANATMVNISFQLKNNVICLKIKDDGAGFEVNKAKSGIGLKNINSRIKEINGTINITSEKNVGTEVTIEAPIP